MNKRNRFAICVLAFMLAFGSIESITANAAEYTPIDTRGPEDNGATTEENMGMAQSMEVQSNEVDNWPKGPVTNGEAAIVMDADSGAILYAKNIDGHAYPASITKVLTTLVALENANINDTVTVAEESISCLGNGYAHVGLNPNEELSLNDALHAVLLASANEASHAVGSSVGEGYDWFIERMNTRAKELGAVNSNFVNTNGVHEDEHYTTAHDMALITQQLYNHHLEFQTISQTLQYKMEGTNLTDEPRYFHQVHKMLYEGNQYYDSRVVAGKTGYTTNAKNTLITCTDDGNLRLIIVVLKTHGQNVYGDTKALLEYGHDNFEKIEISTNDIKGMVENITHVAAGSFVVVPKGVTIKDLKAELKKNDTGISQVVFTYNGQVVGNIDVSLESTEVEKEETVQANEEEKFDFSKIKSIIKGLNIVKILALIFIIAALSFVVLLIILLIYRQKKRAERKRRREARRRQYMREQELKRRQEERERR